jgi:hypothetical protein
MKRSFIIAVSTFLSASLCGWLMARAAFNHQKRSQSPSGNLKEGKHGQRGILVSSPNRIPDEVKEMARAIRAAGSPQEQMRLTLALAGSIPTSEIKKWLNGSWYDECEGFNPKLLSRILLERWMKEDPDGYLTSCMAAGSSDSAVFTEFAKENPGKLLAYYKAHPNDEAELKALTSLAKYHPELVLARLRDKIVDGRLDFSGAKADYAKQALWELAKSDSSALEAMIDSLPSQWQSAVEISCITARLETSFSTEVQKLYAREDGWKILTAAGWNSKVGTNLLDELANIPETWRNQLSSRSESFIREDNARKWFDADFESNGFTADQAAKIRKAALRLLVDSSPEEALGLLSGASLDAGSRKIMVSDIFRHYMDQKEKAASLIAQLDNEEDRKNAEAVIGEDTNSPSSPSFRATIDKPSEMMTAIASIDPYAGNFDRYASLVSNWDQEKMAELCRAFATMPEDQKRNVAIGAAFSARDSPGSAFVGEAITYYLNHPGTVDSYGQREHGPEPITTASVYAVNWAQSDPGSASSWVNSLPSGDAKLWAQKNLANNWSRNDPDAANQWIATLPAKERTEVQTFIKKGGKP